MKPFLATYQWDDLDEHHPVIVIGFASSIDVAVIVPGGQLRTLPISAVRALQSAFPLLGDRDFWHPKAKVEA